MIAFILAAAIQYDSIARAGYGSQAPTAFGSFAADYVTLTDGGHLTNAHRAVPHAQIDLRDVLMAVLHPNPTSVMNLAKHAALVGMVNARTNSTYAAVDKAIAPVTNGILRRYTVWGDRVRIDDPLARTAVIRENGKDTILDLEHRVYQIVPSVTPASGLPAPTGTLPPGNMKSRETITAQTYETYSSVGEKTQWTYAFPAGDGLCGGATREVQQEQYTIASLPFIAPELEPVAHSPGAALSAMCQTSAQQLPPASGFIVYSRVAAIMPMPASAHMNGFEIDSIIERGNIKVLTDDEAKALFEIPAGFTEQHE